MNGLRRLAAGIAGIFVFAAGLPAQIPLQRVDPQVAQSCIFRLNGVQLCTVKHFEAVGLDGISTATILAAGSDKLLPGEVRIVTADFSPVVRTELFELLNRKSGPVTGSLLFLDSSLRTATSIEFGQVSLKEIEMPAMDKGANAIVEVAFRLSVSNVTRPAVPPPSAPGSQSGTRQDPLLKFLFRLSIDGLNTNLMSQFDSFRIRPVGSGDFSLTIRGLPVANPFVDWRGSKNASIDYLNSKQQSVFKLGFTLTKKRLTEEFDFARGERILRIECTYSNFQVLKP